jgi:Mrp family chromosome partitioning ATPase
VAAIVARLTERADLLLIDTPPLLHVSDAMTMMLTAGIDCVILAARLGQVRRQAVADARRLLDTAPVVKLGFFATGGEAGDRYPGDGYYPYYGDRRELIAAARHRLTRS